MQLAMAMAMAIAMAMMSSELMPLSMPPRQDDAHSMIGDFTKISESNSENELLLVWVTSVRFNGQMPDILEVEIWKAVSLWMFFHCLVFSSVHFFTSLLHWIWAQYKWLWHGFLPPLEISQLEVEFPHAPDLLNGFPQWYWSLVRLMDLYDCIRGTVFHLFSFLYYCCMVLYSPRSLHLKRGIM